VRVVLGMARGAAEDGGGLGWVLSEGCNVGSGEGEGGARCGNGVG
jgi:hypothetical protein